MHYADYKTILLPNNTMNIYRGCTHGCIYCDSRSRCYQINHPFEDIEVKRNADTILDDQLRRRRNKAMIASGGMCDPYIPLENELRLTRRCLEVIARHGFGLSILSKSHRMLRDMDVFAEINRKQKCVVCTTLTTFDEALCKKLEPNVSSTAARVEVLMECKRRGIPTVVWLTPILPFINDTQENINGLLDYCIAAGVHGIISFGMGLTLREGDREYFYAQLDQLFPGLKQRYINTFGLRYECSSPNNNRLMALFNERCRTHGILCKPDTVFHFMHTLPEEPPQMTLFDLVDEDV
jgi:DNA repair photolyase